MVSYSRGNRCGIGFIVLNISYQKQLQNARDITKVEYTDSSGTYHKVYYDEDFKALKKENKELYDSLKAYKDQISYLAQFTYTKEYNTGKVESKPANVEVESVTDEGDTLKIYEYSNNPNDTIHYTLRVGSISEPNWYQLNTKISEKFTIVNKSGADGSNHVTIESNNKGTISDVTVFKKEEKKTFWKRFKTGPGATVGYDPINKNFGMAVGWTVTFDITK